MTVVQENTSTDKIQDAAVVPVTPPLFGWGPDLNVMKACKELDCPFPCPPGEGNTVWFALLSFAAMHNWMLQSSAGEHMGLGTILWPFCLTVAQVTYSTENNVAKVQYKPHAKWPSSDVGPVP